jgi:hypothetical protein
MKKPLSRRIPPWPENVQRDHQSDKRQGKLKNFAGIKKQFVDSQVNQDIDPAKDDRSEIR